MKKKIFILSSVLLLGMAIFAGYYLNKPQLSASGKPLDPKIIALNKMEEEVKKLNDQEVLQEINSLMSVVNKHEVMDKYNKNLMDEAEKTNTKNILTKLALLNVEKNRRHLADK